MHHLTRRINHLGACVALVLSLGLAAAQGPVPAPTPAALEGLDAVQAVQLANAWKGADVTSFATTEAVHFAFPGGTEVVVPMPDDQVFVSVAPYLNRTHPCTTHYMSGCQGELVAAPVHVRALRPDGDVVLDEVIATGPNGFLDLWLPRGEAFLLDLTLDGYAVQGIVSTVDGAPTCITTMRLTPQGS
jgi:hypothetical protein